MNAQATIWRRLMRKVFHTRKSAWQTYWTEERKAEVTIIVGSFFLSGLFFWFALHAL